MSNSNATAAYKTNSILSKLTDSKLVSLQNNLNSEKLAASKQRLVQQSSNKKNVAESDDEDNAKGMFSSVHKKNKLNKNTTDNNTIHKTINIPGGLQIKEKFQQLGSGSRNTASVTSIARSGLGGFNRSIGSTIQVGNTTSSNRSTAGSSSNTGSIITTGSSRNTGSCSNSRSTTVCSGSSSSSIWKPTEVLNNYNGEHQMLKKVDNITDARSIAIITHTSAKVNVLGTTAGSVSIIKASDRPGLTVNSNSSLSLLQQRLSSSCAQAIVPTPSQPSTNAPSIVTTSAVSSSSYGTTSNISAATYAALPSKITNENDNFVRKNLKRPGGGSCRYAAVARKSAKLESRAQSRQDDYDKELMSKKLSYSTFDITVGNASSSSSSDINGNLEMQQLQVDSFDALGVDPLDLSLEVITKKSNSKRISSSSGRSKPAARSTAPIPRGLQDPSIAKKIKKKRNGKYDIEFLESIAPNCNGHNFTSKLFTVRKKGSSNKGRQFYGCCYGADDRCSYFLWVEDNPVLIELIVEEEKEKEEKYLNIDPNHVWSMHAVDIFADKLALMNLIELKAEMRRCIKNLHVNKLSHLVNEFGLKVSGTRTYLIDKLVEHARYTLTSATGTSTKKGKPIARTATRDDDITFSDSDDDCGSSDNGSGNGDDGCDDNHGEEEGDAVVDGDTYVDADEDSDSVSHGSNSKAVYRVLRSCFGFNQLRFGQQWAIDRCINGLNSFLISPTGSGKSLCYMVPALLLPGLTVVVSPLISLMQDQLRKLPFHLPGACMGGRMTAQDTSRITVAVLAGTIKVLYVSPERLCSYSFRSLMRSLNDSRASASDTAAAASAPAPAVSLLCIDEAHCLSHWSYNFRPSFLRIRHEIAYIRPRAVLALTATAPPSIQHEIMEHLSIPADTGLHFTSPKRENLILMSQYADSDELRRETITKLIKDNVHFKTSGVGTTAAVGAVAGVGGRKNNGIPVTIIYVTRRHETESLAEYLTGNGLPACCYHAGMDIDQRTKAQKQFDNGSTNIIVATVAFGMGVDKSNVRQVIHACLPKTVENYVQETGRAGRDGNTSICHLVYCKDDVIQQLSMSQSSRFSLIQVIVLLQHIFVWSVDSVKPQVALPLELLQRCCDLSQSIIETLISILESSPFNLLTTSGTYCNAAKGKFKQIDSSLPVSDIVSSIKRKNTLHTKGGSSSSSSSSSNFTDNSGYVQQFQFALQDICDDIGYARSDVTRSLYALQKDGYLEYSLSSPAIFACVSLNAVGSSDAPVTSKEELSRWVVQLATSLYHYTNSIELASKARIVDMWRLASLLQDDNSSDSSDSSSRNDEMKDFICHYLNNMTPTHKTHATPATISDSNATMESMRQRFLHDQPAPTEPMSDALMTKISSDTQVLVNEPNLLKYVQHMCLLANGTINSSADDDVDKTETLSSWKAELLSNYIVKVFHALPSNTNIVADMWKSIAFWGRYKHVDYDDLYALVLGIARK